MQYNIHLGGTFILTHLKFELCSKVFHEHFTRTFYDYRQRSAYYEIQNEFISRYTIVSRYKIS